MTEPTHHFRRDVAAQLDILLAGILANVGLDQLDDARRLLAAELGTAWAQGERTGYRYGVGHGELALNPYDETDKA